MDVATVQPWQTQPEHEAVVWQHNRLAEARYELTAREQKLLLYVIAMIEPEDEGFKRYIINIAEFAQLAQRLKFSSLCSLEPDNSDTFVSSPQIHHQPLNFLLASSLTSRNSLAFSHPDI